MVAYSFHASFVDRFERRLKLSTNCGHRWSGRLSVCPIWARAQAYRAAVINFRSERVANADSPRCVTFGSGTLARPSTSKLV